MSPSLEPAAEAARLKALNTYDILDTLPEAEYDALTKLASVICGTPVALITFIDGDRQWFKSRQGTEVPGTPREIAFCAHTIIDPNAAMVVEDARQDARFAANPLVTGDPHIVFYAGVPIVAGGHALGSLCVLDTEARQLSAEQLAALRALTLQVEALLEARRTNARLARSKEQLEQAVGAAELGIWSLDTATGTVVWDARCRALFGLAADSTIPYEAAIRCIHPGDVARVDAAVQAALRGEDGGRYDATYRTLGADDGMLRWVRFSGTAYHDAAGALMRFGGVAQDVTQQVTARQAIQESEAFMGQVVDSVPAMIFYLDGEQRYRLYNKTFQAWFGVDGAGALGKTIREFIGEAAYARIEQQLARAYAGARVSFEMPAPARLDPEGWLRIVYTPHQDAGGRVLGVVVHATNITEGKQLEFALRASEARFRTLLEKAPVATCLFVGKGRHVVEVANDPMLAIWGKDNSIIGKPLYEALPELEGQPFSGILDALYETGKPYTGVSVPADLEVGGVRSTYYFDFTYQPLFDAAGQVVSIMEMAVDVTEQVTARQKLEASEEFIRAVVDNSPVAKIVFLGEDLVVDVANQSMLRILARDEHIVGQPLLTMAPELRGSALLERLQEVYRSGETYHQMAEPLEVAGEDGRARQYYYNNIYKALHRSDGSVYGLIFTAADVTESVEARQRAEAAEVALNAAIEVAELGTWTIDLVRGAAFYGERVEDWFGVPSGAPLAELFSVVPPDDAARMGATIAAACAPGSDNAIEIEHAVLNPHTGRRRIIHSKGTVLRDATGAPVAIAGTGQDVTLQKDLQLTLETEVQERTEELAAANEELTATNEELQDRTEQLAVSNRELQERTEELAASNEELASINEELHAVNEELTDSNAKLTHSNEELAQYAYVASHDLQEPLRKIQVFSGLLSSKKELSESSRELVVKVGASSERMSALIRDLLEFSRLLSSDALYRPVDLEVVAAAVYSDYELVAAEKGATLTLGWLPTLEAVSLQMNQLFHNLVGNALKFTRPGVAPVIHIAAEEVEGTALARHLSKPMPFATYYRICVQDNGIGFETQYADQIFEVFKRLHNREAFPGSGIGLALCRRIVANHGGALYTASTPGEGSTFCLLLPNRQTDAPSALPGGFTWEKLA